MVTDTPTEVLFMITYLHEGLLRRDSYYQELQPAQAHCHYLQTLFPEAQVELHHLALAEKPDLFQSRRSHFLEF